MEGRETFHGSSITKIFYLEVDTDTNVGTQTESEEPCHIVRKFPKHILPCQLVGKIFHGTSTKVKVQVAAHQKGQSLVRCES